MEPDRSEDYYYTEDGRQYMRRNSGSKVRFQTDPVPVRIMEQEGDRRNNSSPNILPPLGHRVSVSSGSQARNPPPSAGRQSGVIAEPVKQLSTARGNPTTSRVPHEAHASKKKQLFAHEAFVGRVDTFVKPKLRMLQHGDPESIRSDINGLEDVDFVLIVKRNKDGIIDKITGCLTRNDDIDRERVRETYLQLLRDEYGVVTKTYLTKEYVFYAINLSFAHLGLMTQLLSYQWCLAPPLDDPMMSNGNDHPQTHSFVDDITHGIKPYKAFYFMKKKKPKPDHGSENSKTSPVKYLYLAYQHCSDRKSFSSQLRHDLAYNFLVGARVNLVLEEHHDKPPVRSVSGYFDQSQRNQLQGNEQSVNLNSVMAHQIFDDFLGGLHQPLRERKCVVTPRQASLSPGNACCFSKMTCQQCGCCTPTNNNQSTGDHAAEGGLCDSIRGMWNEFWYSNAIECVDLDQRPDENDREYLNRVSTIRNSLTPTINFHDQIDEFGSAKDEGRNKKRRNKNQCCGCCGSSGRQRDEESGPTDGDEDDEPSFDWMYRMRHLIPLDKLRHYLGEKIGFYFAWVELLIMSLVAPAIVGVAMFIAGVIYYSIMVATIDHDDETGKNNNATEDGSNGHVKYEEEGNESPGYVLGKACDNYATIGFAAVVIIWGTTFGELWKRRNSWYQFLWHVEHLNDAEPRRVNNYPFRWMSRMHDHWFTHGIMFVPSLVVTVLFFFLVWASIYLINMLDVRLSLEYCRFPAPVIEDDTGRKLVLTTTTMAPTANGTESSMLSEVVSKASSWFLCNIITVVLNSVSIVILDGIFSRLCYPLTHLEGHDTQTSFNNWLILKMFAFRFVNNYSVLFYIAFVVAPQYDTVVYPYELTGVNSTDPLQVEAARFRSCKQLPCMTLLSKQLLSIIVMSPLIKAIKDRLLPPLLHLAMRLFCAKKKSGKVDDEPTSYSTVSDKKVVEEIKEQQELSELSTLSWREFTIEEFTEKVTVYGALMMFSVALPPAPALAMLIMRIDLNFDIARIMDSFRRPIPLRASGIGVWAEIVDFLTFCGIVTNPLVVVLTSSWGSQLTIWWKFGVFLIFEHIVFAIRALVSACVPDEPRQLSTLRLRHKIAKERAVTG